MITVTSPGLDALKAKIALIQRQLQPTLQTAVSVGGLTSAQRFNTAAPVGKEIDSTTIQGDAPGRLSQSFKAKPLAVPYGAGVTVYTIQPTKLRFVWLGTGVFGPLAHRIYPLNAKALFWAGAAHPYRSTKGQRPNDFISPTMSVAKQDIRDAVGHAMFVLLGGL